jgi:hypothetical protein
MATASVNNHKQVWTDQCLFMPKERALRGHRIAEEHRASKHQSQWGKIIVEFLPIPANIRGRFWTPKVRVASPVPGVPAGT